MGITIVVEYSDGEIMRKMDDSPLLNRILGFCEDNNIQTRILKYIDPYDDTTLNSFQIPDLITDIEYLMSLSNLENEWKSFLEELKEVCFVTCSLPHQFLKFYGD